MTLQQIARNAAPWLVLAAGSSLTATIVVVAPEVGREVLFALLGAWVLLAVVRIIALVGLTRRAYHNLVSADLSR